MYKRKILTNQKGVSPILETLVAVGISIALLVIFFISTTNIFTAHDKPNIDVEAKCISITEALINTPGSASGYDYDWEDKPDNVDFVGLATTELIAYGKANITNSGKVTILSYNRMDRGIGIAQTCFLAGTKIVLSDESYKNIENIKVGDTVKSYDEKTGKITDCKVTKIFHHGPEEMGEYYIVINNQLRVTPNHMFYLDGKWIYASSLKIGDSLCYASKSQPVYSIEKIYEQEPTYNFEVEGNHNYFVALYPTNVLVHNPTLEPTANFTWFDSDGPYSPGVRIFLNAESSAPINPGDTLTYYWYWDATSPGSTPDAIGCYAEFNPGPDNKSHPVTLKVTEGATYDYCTIYVQANQPENYVIDQKPWVLTGKNIYPPVNDNTLTSYGENYYIKYTRIENESDSECSTYIFEIKEKAKPSYTILDLDKIANLNDTIYYDVKSALGLSTKNDILYNFNITLVTEEHAYYYGASFNYTDLLESVKKDVLVYYKPVYVPGSPSHITEPSYRKGEITVRVFVGGTVPNYPPRTPSDPSPLNGDTAVKWNTYLNWTGGDVNPYDTVTYTLTYGDLSSTPTKIYNLATTTYKPTTILKPNTTYNWNILARDNHGAEKQGPTWTFKTLPDTAPNAPDNPHPLNETTEASANKTNLSWTCTDPDSEMGDKLTYDVFFGKVATSLYKISNNNWNHTYWNSKQNRSTMLARLDYNTIYYWKIKSTDNYSNSTNGPIWNFKTAEKGLDQYSTYGAGDYNPTLGSGIGQTIIARSNGNLTKIKLLLKSGEIQEPQQSENITVDIYECFTPNPNDGFILLGKTNISSFDNTSYVWKEADFSDKKTQIHEGKTYFIKIQTKQKRYLWQYSQIAGKLVGLAEQNNPYKYGTAWYYDGSGWKDLSRDFSFKTIVLRPFILDQFCNDHQGDGTVTGSGLAQTFISTNMSGDLMKVNLSLKNNLANHADITVKIYTEKPDSPNKILLGTTTIKGFTSTSYIWKQANFTSNPPYLQRGKEYFIQINTSGLSSYNWEVNRHDYPYGCNWTKKGGSVWVPGPSDFIFGTYMDYIDDR